MARHGMDDRQPPQPFYRGCVIEPGFEFAVFVCDYIVGAVRQSEASRNYHVDGTFRVRPNGQFDQLLLMHWEHRGQSWPFLYVLMYKRSTAAYIALWRYIEAEVLELRPASIMSDFEVAIRSSIRSQYPDCLTTGCYFHYTQANSRKASKIGLIKQLHSTEHRTLFLKFLRLPLLPANCIREGFEMLKLDVPHVDTCWTEFLSYFEKQWLEKEGPTNISVYGRLHRTNNLVESHNSRLRAILPPSGNLYKFLDGLSREAGRKADNLKKVMEGLEAGGTRRNAKWEDLVKKNQNYLNDGRIGVGEFLSAVAVRPTDAYDVIEMSDESDGNEDVEDSYVAENKRLTSLVVCVICCMANKEILCLPCRHMAVCKKCWDCSTKNDCPLCSNKVETYICVNM